MNIKSVPLNEIIEIIKRLESAGRFNDADLFRKSVFGTIRKEEGLTDQAGEKLC